jgi:hypothetical protein
VVLKRSAALLKLPRSATKTKVSSCLRLSFTAFA